MKQQDKKEKNGGFNMMKTLRKQLKNEKGLTLIELLAVIVILAIIAAIAIPAIGNIITNSKYNAIKSDGINVINAAQLYYLDNPDETNAVSVSVLKGNADNNGEGAATADGVYLENPGTINDDATVSPDAPHTLSNGKAELNSYTISFENISIEGINRDNTKGSKIEEDYTVGSDSED